MSKKLINKSVVLNVVGTLIIITGFLMALAIPFSFYYDDGMQFVFKTNDSKYIIHSINGGIFYSDIQKCKKKYIDEYNTILFLILSCEEIL